MYTGKAAGHTFGIGSGLQARITNYTVYQKFRNSVKTLSINSFNNTSISCYILIYITYINWIVNGNKNKSIVR